MDELFTVNVYQVSGGQRDSHNNNNNNHSPIDNNNDSLSGSTKLMDEYQNMTSARVIKGRMLELEHSNLAGPSVKFKTVVNYEKTLESGSYLGVSFRHQDGYIQKD